MSGGMPQRSPELLHTSQMCVWVWGGGLLWERSAAFPWMPVKREVCWQQVEHPQSVGLESTG